MGKKQCVVCEKELGFLTAKTDIADGTVCWDCLKSGGMIGLSPAKSFTAASVKQIVRRRAPLVNSFSPNKSIGSYIKIDEAHRCFKVGEGIFEYANLLSFELLEDGHSITKGGLGRAVAGGLLFGGVGAVVGGITGGKKTNDVCSSLKIKLTLKNAQKDVEYINFLWAETKKSSIVYKNLQPSVQACLSALQIIADVNQNEYPVQAAPVAAGSVADEILKYKQLLDAGAITQAEFEAMKKQLLGG